MEPSTQGLRLVCGLVFLLFDKSKLKVNDVACRLVSYSGTLLEGSLSHGRVVRGDVSCHGDNFLDSGS